MLNKIFVALYLLLLTLLFAIILAIITHFNGFNENKKNKILFESYQNNNSICSDQAKKFKDLSLKKRYALVINNKKEKRYENSTKKIFDLLGALGFETILKSNLQNDNILNEVDIFIRRPEKCVRVYFYSGNVSVRKLNNDSNTKSIQNSQNELNLKSFIYKIIDKNSFLNIVFISTSKNIIFDNSLYLPENLFLFHLKIASTQKNVIDKNVNDLLRVLIIPGVDFRSLFNNFQNINNLNVQNINKLKSTFCFNPNSLLGCNSFNVNMPLESTYWNRIKNLNSISEIDFYIKYYPNGQFLDIAKNIKSSHSTIKINEKSFIGRIKNKFKKVNLPTNKYALKKSGHLTLRSNLYKDSVYINDFYYGQTRIDLLMPIGTYNIRIEKSCYQGFSENVYLSQGGNEIFHKFFIPECSYNQSTRVYMNCQISSISSRINPDGFKFKDVCGIPSWITEGLDQKGIYSGKRLLNSIKGGFADFSGAYLEHIDLNTINLKNKRFRGTNFKNAVNVPNWLKAGMRNNYVFEMYHLSDAIRYGFRQLNGANLEMAKLSQVDLKNVDLRNANLKGAHLKDANLEGADLRNTNLSGAHLDGANLRNTKLNYANFSGAWLYETDFDGAVAIKASFDDAQFNYYTEGKTFDLVIFPSDISDYWELLDNKILRRRK